MSNKFAWNPFTHSATAMFLMVLVPFTMYGVYFYISHPWKLRIYNNYLLLLIILANVAGTLTHFYVTKKAAKALGNWPINAIDASILLGISVAAAILGRIFNSIMDIFEGNDEETE